MASIFSFPAGPIDGLPPARRDLARCFGEIAGLSAEDKRLEGIEAHLQGDVAKAVAAEAQYDDAIDADASMLIARLRDGLSGLWGSVGGRARRAGAAMIDAHSDKLVAERALAAVIAEREKIQGRAQALEQDKRDLINAVVVESIGAGLKAELAESLETARLALTRLEALRRAVDPAPVDYHPTRRAAIIVDASSADDTELVVEGREVDKSFGILEGFKASLERDPLAPAPAFPDLDLSMDENVVFHDLRLGEQRERAADPRFLPKVSHKTATAV